MLIFYYHFFTKSVKLVYLFWINVYSGFFSFMLVKNFYYFTLESNFTTEPQIHIQWKKIKIDFTGNEKPEMKRKLFQHKILCVQKRLINIRKYMLFAWYPPMILSFVTARKEKTKWKWIGMACTSKSSNISSISLKSGRVSTFALIKTTLCPRNDAFCFQHVTIVVFKEFRKKKKKPVTQNGTPNHQE